MSVLVSFRILLFIFSIFGLISCAPEMQKEPSYWGLPEPVLVKVKEGRHVFIKHQSQQKVGLEDEIRFYDEQNPPTYHLPTSILIISLCRARDGKAQTHQLEIQPRSRIQIQSLISEEFLAPAADFANCSIAMRGKYKSAKSQYIHKFENLFVDLRDEEGGLLAPADALKPNLEQFDQPLLGEQIDISVNWRLVCDTFATDYSDVVLNRHELVAAIRGAVIHVEPQVCRILLRDRMQNLLFTRRFAFDPKLPAPKIDISTQTLSFDRMRGVFNFAQKIWITNTSYEDMRFSLNHISGQGPFRFLVGQKDYAISGEGLAKFQISKDLNDGSRAFTLGPGASREVLIEIQAPYSCHVNVGVIGIPAIPQLERVQYSFATQGAWSYLDSAVLPFWSRPRQKGQDAFIYIDNKGVRISDEIKITYGGRFSMVRCP